jgi:hypothetical protein
MTKHLLIPRPSPSSALRRLVLPAAVLTALVALLAALTPAGPAHAVSGGGAAPFAVTPTPAVNGASRSYFILEAHAGATLHDQVVVSNLDKKPQTLKISVARGTTAPNTGSAFAGAFQACSGTACWVSGLPTAIALKPGESRTLPFTVHVPAGIADRQYLSGITVRPAKNPAPVQVGGGHGAKAQAVVVNEVTVGVAVTVGTHLHTELGIVKATGGVTGTTSLIDVTVDDPGQTFVGGSGQVTCTTPRGSLRFPVGVNTVLPGDSGTVQVTAAGLPAGTYPCTVSITYAGGAAPATWQGQVTIPQAHPVKRVEVAPGVFAAVPGNHIPTWAIALIIAGGVVIVALLVTIVILLVRRRRTPPHAAETDELTSASSRSD